MSQTTPLEEPTIKDEDLSFLSAYLKDVPLEEIRNRVMKIWRDCASNNKALYGCIRQLLFVHPNIQKHPFYEQLISSRDPKSTLLDLGCCFGTDTRKLILDGWDPKLISVIDVTPDYWNLSFTLFNDKETLPIKSKFGNVTVQDAFAKDISGHFDYVWTGLVLHVLSKSEVEKFMRRIMDFLKPGGTYFGTCVGSPQPGEWIPTPSGKDLRWLHSKDSLKQLLEERGFVDVVVEEQPFELLSANTDGLKREMALNPGLADRDKIYLLFRGSHPQ